MASKSTANMPGKLMTVKSLIDPDNLGVTLVEEQDIHSFWKLSYLTYVDWEYRRKI